MIWLVASPARDPYGDMEKKSSVSKAKTYSKIGEFWDNHDLADYWDQTEAADIEVDLQDETVLYALPRDLSERLRESARDQGLSPRELLNRLVKDRLEDS